MYPRKNGTYHSCYVYDDIKLHRIGGTTICIAAVLSGYAFRILWRRRVVKMHPYRGTRPCLVA